MKDDQFHSFTISSSNHSDTRSIDSSDKESLKQEKSDYDCISSELIEALFRCSFCDRHFESSLHRNEHEKRHKSRLLKHICIEMSCDRRFKNEDELKRHVQSVSQVLTQTQKIF